MKLRARRGGPSLEVYLETNVFSDLFPREDSSRAAQLRRDVRASARTGQITYVTSGWTIEELAGVAEHDAHRYRRVVRFLFDLVGDGLIDDPPTLGEKELRLGRRLRGAERMIPRDRLNEYRRAALDLAIARDTWKQTSQAKREGKVELTGIRETIWKRLSELAKDDPVDRGDPRAATLRWFAEVDRWMDEWSRKSLAGVLQDLGSDPTDASTYPLDRVPTIVNVTGAMLARLAWNSGHGRRIDEGDNLDSRHYVAACYAGLLVTSDRRFGGIVDLLPKPGVTVTTLDDFAREYLGW